MSTRRLRSGLWVGCLGVAACASVAGVLRFKSSVPGDAGPPAIGPPAAQQPIEPPVGELTLDESERRYLWEVEHHGQLLSQRGFKALSQALRQADAPALRRLFATGFEGSALRQPREVALLTDFAQVVRQEDLGNSLEQLNAEQFVERLMQFRRKFASTPQAQISLIGLSPPTRDNFEGVWSGSCQLRLWGESAPKAPAEVVLSLRFRVTRPSDEIFQGVGWLKACAITQTAVAGAPHPLMREVAAERGIDRSRFHDNWESASKLPTTGGVYLCDYDRDGYLDMLVTDVNGCYLFRGQPGGKFRQVYSAVDGVRLTPSYSVAAFVDLDGDGWDDLILGNRLYQNQPDEKGGRRFVNVTGRSNLQFPAKASQVVVTDYDRDGRLDLYFTYPGSPKVGSWVSGKSGDARTNLLMRNKGDWQFEDVTVASGVGGANRSCFSAVWLDSNNDGWPDVHVINEFGNGVLLVNRGDGTFREQMLRSGPMDFGSMGVTCGDIDNDGNIDLYIANMYSKAGTRVLGNLRPNAYSPELTATMKRFVTGSQLWRNRGNLQFEPKGQEWQVAGVGWAYGAALADLDNDGFLDIYATAGFFSQNREEPDG